jgi:general secretion pathway protein G
MSRRLKTVAIIPVMVVLGIAAYAGTAIRVCSFPKSHIVGMQLVQIHQKLERYKLEQGDYPTAEQGLAALTRYINPDALVDPWHNEVRCEYDVYSCGADGRPGGVGEDADIYADLGFDRKETP